MPYLATIGLEVHCRVKTRMKMFCACERSFGEEPNTRTCPVCLGLPVLNRHAIEKALLPEISRWDLKSHFFTRTCRNR
jgi:aspartyl-tRNA(Asn)/glutamyl-tRNA(Gln) amidotransferase subunit B